MKTLVASLLIAGFSGPVLAYDYGRWLCPECAWGGADIPKTGVDGAAAKTFIFATNDSIMKSGPFAKSPEPRWVPGDTITLCDGASCVTFAYHALTGLHLPITGTFKDNGRGYKNSKATITGGVVGGVGANFSLVFRDYTSPTAHVPVVLPRYGTVVVGPTTVVGQTASFGSGFSMGYAWGGGARSSDEWGLTNQGGWCDANGKCVREK